MLQHFFATGYNFTTQPVAKFLAAGRLTIPPGSKNTGSDLPPYRFWQTGLLPNGEFALVLIGRLYGSALPGLKA
jgi:hypothetical protein